MRFWPLQTCLVLTVLGSGDPALAAPKKKKDEKARAAAAAPSAPATTQKSATNRQGKVVVIEPELGLVNALDSGYGARVGVFLSPNTIFEADYFSASFAFLGLQDTVALGTARLQYFVGNSFYVAGGGGVRQLTATNNFGDTLLGPSSGSYYSKQSATQAVAELAIGNQWQFRSFTLGCDWVGYAVPLATMSTAESVSGASNPSQLADDESHFKSERNGGSLELVRFRLGWSF